MDDQNRQGGNLINFTNNAISGLKTIRFAPIPSLLPIFIALISILAIFTVSILLETPAQSSEGNQSENQTQNQGQTVNLPPSPGCTSGDYIKCLLDFKIEARGFDGDNAKFAKDAFEAFSIAYNGSSLYRERWNNGNKILILSYGKPDDALYQGPSCTGQAYPNKGGPSYDMMNIWNWDACHLSDGNGYIMVHETGHILEGRNPQLYNKFSDGNDDNGQLPGLISLDTTCYKPYIGGRSYLNTYIGPGALWNEENFAEGIADYVLYRSWQPHDLNTGQSLGLPNFQTQCSNTYNWFRTNVFGFDTNLNNPFGL